MPPPLGVETSCPSVTSCVEGKAGRGTSKIARGGSSGAVKATVISDSSTESETVEVSDGEQFQQIENKINTIRTQFYEAKKRLTKAKAKAACGQNSKQHLESKPKPSAVPLPASKPKPAAQQKKPGRVVEVFCGSANLAFEFHKQEFKTSAVDSRFNKDMPRVKSINLDLTLPEDQRVLWEMILDAEVEFVHFGVPCETASRAREVRLKNTSIDPQPLRSDRFPDGPTLSGEDATKIEKANALYEFTAKAILVLAGKGIGWSLENPENSLLWKTSWMRQVAQVLEEEKREVSFQMCMHGGGRPKKSKLWFGNVKSLATLGLKCDGDHQHLPWGFGKSGPEKFATAEERRYPTLFCRRFVKAVMKDLGYDKPLPQLEAHNEKVFLEPSLLKVF